MENPALIIMAAGMGSRFGGLKQITPVGDNGEIIMDFSLYDAYQAGFRKVAFVIKKEREADFRAIVGSHVESRMGSPFPKGAKSPGARRTPCAPAGT